MNSALIFTLIILASMAVATADVSVSEMAYKYYLINQAWNVGPTCAHYGGHCFHQHCCQYYKRSRIQCFSGQCLQAVCGHPGQRCGSWIGECCYHMGLSCVSRGYAWEGICSYTGGPIAGGTYVP
ncbi:hypothetical protein BsWGS_26003 [Bradybaena similaris]